MIESKDIDIIINLLIDERDECVVTGSYEWEPPLNLNKKEYISKFKEFYKKEGKTYIREDADHYFLNRILAIDYSVSLLKEHKGIFCEDKNKFGKKRIPNLDLYFRLRTNLLSLKTDEERIKFCIKNRESFLQFSKKGNVARIRFYVDNNTSGTRSQWEEYNNEKSVFLSKELPKFKKDDLFLLDYSGINFEWEEDW